MTTPQKLDPEGFHELEQTGWETVADQFANYFGGLTSLTIGALLDAVGAGPGMRLLDVASGPGYVAAAAAAMGASALGVDFAAAMVALARSRYPQIEFREGDAEQLSLADATFDAVTM